jgi:MinD-like ATPase involved in chromosome partitioning or flagellar assembly/tetratricopeptide (TPR) repeat protein
MTDNRNGQVVTFYSYKGGTGRTMALANVAWILAANGRRVLVVDWDLESPGLHRFLSPFIDPDALASTGGVINLIREYEWATIQKVDRGENWHEQFARVHKYSFSVDWPQFPGEGRLDYLSAGRQNRDYAATLAGLDWDDFYEKLDGGLFFDALRADMKRHYDYTLIDSRTGLSDVADICTIHMPDILVDCFTLSDQGIDGAAHVAHAVGRRYPGRNIRILPVAMRVDPAEKLKAEAGQQVAKQRFAGLPAGLNEADRDAYWTATTVPYQAYYAYEETLATFGDLPGASGSLLSAYELMTSHITDGAVTKLPPMDEVIRHRVNARFARQPMAVEQEVTLRYASEDRVWAEWIEHLLVGAGVRVNDTWTTTEEQQPAGRETARELTIISSAKSVEIATSMLHRDGARSPLAVYVADVPPLPHIPVANSGFVAGVAASTAAERVLKLVGRNTAADDNPTQGGPRYPGSEPEVFNVPARNARFTGREKDLRQLRSRLRAGGTAVVLSGSMPVTLHGMGGIGKTQVAMEYAYRFRSSYDLVWWIDADPITSVEGSLADLGSRLGIPVLPSVRDTARAVLQALTRGEPYARWLLIFDSAEEPENLGDFMPRGNGHVLVTSRNPSWTDTAQAIHIDVFERDESIAHLRQRVPSIRPDEAHRVAEMLGDLPIAVAAAGAWLADTGAGVDEYMREIERLGLGVLAVDATENRSVEATWDLSLQRLRDRSPAAYRLLQLCSVLAPEIALELVYSDTMATALVPFDPSVSERIVRASLVQQINRLSLLRLDQRGDRIARGERVPPGLAVDRSPGGQLLIHRLLQHVVRSRMTEDELTEARHHVHLVLGAARPDGEVDDPETWQRFRILWPHLEPSNAVECSDESVRRLLIDRVRYLWIRGDLTTGHERARMYRDSWTASLENLPDSTERQVLRRQLLHLSFNEANILGEMGRFDESRHIDEAVLAEQRELLGPDHAHTLMTAGSLARDLRGLGRYAEALELDQATYAAWQERFGEEHPRTIAALNNLAVDYRLMGDFRAALERDEAVYQLRRVVLSENHFLTLITAANIGRDLREAGEYERSVALLENVHTTHEQVWGTDSQGALNAQANLAVSLRSAGRAHDAAGLLDYAYERLNDRFGPAAPDTLACRLSRSVNMLELDEMEAAQRELQAVRDSYERSLGESHPHTLVCLSNLAAMALAMNDPVRARDLSGTASERLAQVLFPDHPYALAAQMNFAICVAASGDAQAAIEPMRDATARITRTFGPHHPHTMRCQANLALLLDRVGAAGDVELNDTLRALADTIGVAHPAVNALREGRLLRRIIDPHPF